MYRFAAFIALALGIYLASVAYSAGEGGDIFVAAIVFIATGWVIYVTWRVSSRSPAKNDAPRDPADRLPGESSRDATNRQLIDALVQGSRDWNEFVADPDAQHPGYRKCHQTGDHEGDYSPPDDCDILHIDGRILGLLLVKTHTTVVVNGLASSVWIDGGHVSLTEGSRVPQGVTFKSGRLKIHNGATISGNLRIQKVDESNPIRGKLVEHSTGGYIYMPYGPGTEPFIGIEAEATIEDGIYGTDNTSMIPAD
jgi:hypothetical protein